MSQNNNNNKVVVKEIRKLNSDSIRSFVDTVYDNFSYLSSNPELSHNRHELTRLLSSPDFVGFFVYYPHDHNKIIGYLIGEFKHLNDGRYVYYISYFFVAKAYRGKKIGSKLLSLLINKCKEWGLKFILLTCNRKNHRLSSFYKTLGFTEDPILRTRRINEVFSIYL